MLILPIEQAAAGMTLALGVNDPSCPQQQLAPPQTAMDEPLLAQLRQLGVAYVHVERDELAKADSDLMMHDSLLRSLLVDQVGRTLAAIRGEAPPSVAFPDYYASVRQMTLALLQTGSRPKYVDRLARRMGEHPAEHAATVAHLALALGMRLEKYLVAQRSRLHPSHAREVVNLGVAGLLHDIGKCKLPPEQQQYCEVRRPTAPADQAGWHSHVTHAIEMLHNGIEPSALAAVAQHHQHFDGSGLPAETMLAGEKIHIFARILLVADLYDHLCHDGPRRRLPIEVLHLLRSRYAAWIDPVILAALPEVIVPMPTGMVLTLSNSLSAVIVRQNLEDPFGPIVRRIDRDGRISPEPIDLAGHETLRIRTCGGIDVRECLAEPWPAASRRKQSAA